MSTVRSVLRKELTKQLVSSLCQMGFSGPKVIAGNSLIYEFKRPSSNGNHVLTVQLEKHGLPRFTVNLTVEPAEGFDSVIQSGGTVIQGRLQPRRGATTASWFRTDASLWRRALGQAAPTPEKVVAACVALLPEVDAWWYSQTSSEHISVIEHRYRGNVDT